MITFECDYNEGAHPLILDAFIKTNMEQLPGYGEDHYTFEAIEKIKKACNKKNAQVFFLTGGTQTNQFIIDTTLDSFEGVVSVATGHVTAHEAGAIEHTGHKVLVIPQHDGKMDAKELDEYIIGFYNDGNYEHMVYPGMVYITYPTEYGTLYTKKELLAVKEICMKHNLPLFIDGARLGYGLMSDESDVTLEDIANIADVFYIGGTKLGALCGEAIVYPNGNAPKAMKAQIKQHGALVAKGRLLGIQFDTLFTDDLYFKIAKNAIEQSKRLKKVFLDNGYKLFINSPTNQQFFIIDNETIEKLKTKVGFSFWENYDNEHTVVRFATSWATTDEKIDELDKILKSIM